MELQPIQSKIYEIRGQRVMLDFDLAELYQVETKRLKDAISSVSRATILCLYSRKKNMKF